MSIFFHYLQTKIWNEKRMQITWFVLFYMMQAWTKDIEKRLEFIKQKNILKLKINLIGWFLYDKVQRQSTDFPLQYLRH